MNLIISNNSNIPIYEQIKNAIINQIMTDELVEDEPLPSIRSLAQDAKISIMTIKKAYDELEEEGYIVTKQGKGSNVARKNTELTLERARKDIESKMTEIVDISCKYNIDKREILDLLEFLYGSDKN